MKMNETKTMFRTRMLQIENPSWGSKSLMAYRLCAIGQGWLFNGFLWSQLPSSPLPSSPSLADFIMIPFPGVNFRHSKSFHMALYFLEWCVCSWSMPVKKEDTRWLWLWWCLNIGNLCKFDFSWELNSIPGWNWIWFGLSFRPSLLAAQSAGLGGLCWTHE